MSDLIDRQEALNEMDKYYHHIQLGNKKGLTKEEARMFLDLRATIQLLSSAEPEGEQDECAWKGENEASN